MKKAELYPDLEWTENKFTYAALAEELYRLALVRYATRDQLYPFNKQIYTKPNLQKLVNAGYLTLNNPVIYSITDKCRIFIEKEGHNINVLQKSFTGNSLGHALAVTGCLLKLQGQPHFYAVFYPIFREPPKYEREYLRPDFCVLWKNGDHVKLQFGEVETKKPDWENYLLVKRGKYETIAQDPNTYAMWWKFWSDKLNLPYGEAFCFSVLCFGNIKKDWEGWTWELI